MANLLNTCAECFDCVIPECIRYIQVRAGSENAGLLYYTVTNKFGKQFKGAAIADVNGLFTIDTYDLLPDGALNRFAGAFKLEIQKDVAYCNPETISICDVDYSCISFTPVGCNGYADSDTVIIPCLC